jgi:hypothetical protein
MEYRTEILQNANMKLMFHLLPGLRRGGHGRAPPRIPMSFGMHFRQLE